MLMTSHEAMEEIVLLIQKEKGLQFSWQFKVPSNEGVTVKPAGYEFQPFKCQNMNLLN